VDLGKTKGRDNVFVQILLFFTTLKITNKRLYSSHPSSQPNNQHLTFFLTLRIMCETLKINRISAAASVCGMNIHPRMKKYASASRKRKEIQIYKL
jgi:hypothetical protein